MECGYCLDLTDDLKEHLKTCQQRRYLLQELLKIKRLTIEDVSYLMWRIFKSPNEEEIKKSNKIIYNGEEGLNPAQLLHLEYDPYRL